jgi:hypothetical protein
MRGERGHAERGRAPRASLTGVIGGCAPLDVRRMYGGCTRRTCAHSIGTCRQPRRVQVQETREPCGFPGMYANDEARKRTPFSPTHLVIARNDVPRSSKERNLISLWWWRRAPISPRTRRSRILSISGQRGVSLPQNRIAPFCARKNCAHDAPCPNPTNYRRPDRGKLSRQVDRAW